MGKDNWIIVVPDMRKTGLEPAAYMQSAENYKNNHTP